MEAYQMRAIFTFLYRIGRRLKQYFQLILMIVHVDARFTIGIGVAAASLLGGLVLQFSISIVSIILYTISAISFALSLFDLRSYKLESQSETGRTQIKYGTIKFGTYIPFRKLHPSRDESNFATSNDNVFNRETYMHSCIFNDYVMTTKAIPFTNIGNRKFSFFSEDKTHKGNKYHTLSIASNKRGIFRQQTTVRLGLP